MGVRKDITEFSRDFPFEGRYRGYAPTAPSDATFHGAQPGSNPSSDFPLEQLVRQDPAIEHLIRMAALARLEMANAEPDDERYNSKKFGWGVKDVDFPDDNGGVEKRRRLVPMQESEATDETGWWPTTNEYLNALADTRLGEGWRENVYRYANELMQSVLGDELMDQQEGMTPWYPKVLEGLPASTRAALMNPQGGDASLDGLLRFEMPGLGSKIFSGAMPALASVTNDVEKSAKTSTMEKLGRGALDVGDWAISFMLPYVGATKLAKVGMLAERPFARGALTGAATVPFTRAFELGSDAGLKYLTGEGPEQGPVDPAALATEMLLAGATGGLGEKVSPSKRIIRDVNLRKAAYRNGDPDFWKKYAAMTDRPDNFKLVTSDEVGPWVSQGSKDFQRGAFKSFDEAYPDAGILMPQVERPKWRKPTKDEPGPDFDQYYYLSYLPKVRSKLDESKLPFEFDDNFKKTAKKALTPNTVTDYLMGNEPVFIPMGELPTITKAVKGDKVVGLPAKATGDPALEAIMQQGRLGNMKPNGAWTPADEAEQAAYDKAKLEYAKRKNMGKVSGQQVRDIDHKTGVRHRLGQLGYTLLGTARTGIPNAVDMSEFLNVLPFETEDQPDITYDRKKEAK